MRGKKLIIFLVFILIAVFILTINFLNKNKADYLGGSVFIFEEKDFFSSEKIIVAACPTFHYMLQKMEENKNIETIKTQSTKESLDLLSRKKVDLVISGRALKSEEPDFLFEVIGPGYDFIFKEEIAILEKEMDFISFYTDLSPKNIINDFYFISEENLKKIENIYNYLDKGVVITFLDGKIKGETVHIFQENGERIRLSRLPRLYYLEEIKEKAIFVKEIIKED